MLVCFEELENRVGERIKSVLILVLAAFLVVELGTKGEVKQTAGAVYEAELSQPNPVDAFFESRLTAEMNSREREILTLLHLECWEKELVHAYAQLAEEVPFAFVEKEDYGMSALSHFGAYTEAQGYLEAYYEVQDWKQMQEGKESEAAAENTLSQLQLVKTEQKLQLVREQTLRLYEKLVPESQKEMSYVFDVAEAEQMLTNSGL